MIVEPILSLGGVNSELGSAELNMLRNSAILLGI